MAGSAGQGGRVHREDDEGVRAPLRLPAQQLGLLPAVPLDGGGEEAQLGPQLVRRLLHPQAGGGKAGAVRVPEEDGQEEGLVGLLPEQLGEQKGENDQQPQNAKNDNLDHTVFCSHRTSPC